MTSANRWQVADHILDLVRSHAAVASDVTVENGWPGDAGKSEAIWLGQIEGDLTLPLAMAGRKYMDDQFDLTFDIRVSNRANRADTADRMDDLIQVFLDITQDDPTLDDYPGIVSALCSTIRQTPPIDTPTMGHQGFAQVVVSVHSRLD